LMFLYVSILTVYEYALTSANLDLFRKYTLLDKNFIQMPQIQT